MPKTQAPSKAAWERPTAFAVGNRRFAIESGRPKIGICQLYISPEHNFFGHRELPPGENPLIEQAELCCVAGRGDRFFDYKENYKGQISFFSSQVFAEVCHRLGVAGKPPGVTRRNVITATVDLNSLVGREFEIPGVRFSGTAECCPCYWMNRAIAPGAEKLLQGQGGLGARILSDGILRV
jgi:hypothetical protein